jgi:Flp pilus assembly protein TadG
MRSGRRNGGCGRLLRIWEGLRREEGAQIIELAITLPLLAVLMVGIFDFGQAFNTKQKITAAIREATRFAANQGITDLATAPPPSILSVRDLVSGYLKTNNMTDCGLGTVAPVSQAPAPMNWKFTASGCVATMTLTVNRGHTFTYTQGGNTYTVESTKIDISYPFQWHFNGLIKLVAPGANYAGVTQLTATAAIPNLH